MAGRPRDPALDKAILTAALDVFVEHGINGTSIEQIAKRAGVGKLSIYRRWSTKERLIVDAIESLVVREDIHWPTEEEIRSTSPYELVRQNLRVAARTAADPRFRALVAQIYGSSVSHPVLMETYWKRYIVPRRQLTFALLERAQKEGTVAADADLEVLVDMLAGGVTYRVLQPNPPTERQLRRHLEAAYHQVGLLP
jgi:AcrR family transcriptional regulator